MSPRRWRAAPPDVPLFPAGTAERVQHLLFPAPHPYADDPVGWIRDVCGEQPWSLQATIAESVRDHRYNAVQSCHDAGKSWLASRLLAWWVDVWRDRAFVVWTAPRWPQVNGIIGEELRKLVRRGIAPGRITRDCNWYLDDGTLVGMGRKPADHDAHGFQGIHREKVFVVVDEACGIPESLWNAIDAILTNEDARGFAIGNPDDPTSKFKKICSPGSGWVRHVIDGLKTPNFTGEIDVLPAALRTLLLSRVWVEERRTIWGEKSPIWKNKVRGQFAEIDDFGVFPASIIRRAQMTDLPGRERGVGGLDIAAYGDDSTVLYRNRGGVARRELRHSKVGPEETSERVAHHLTTQGIRDLPVWVDVIGLGLGPYERLRAMGYAVLPFDASAAAHDSRRFGNRRAEAYWTAKVMMEDGLIDLDPDDDDLVAQMGVLRWYLRGGRIYIESKEDLRKRFPDMGSPDELDAFVMSCQPAADPGREALAELRIRHVQRQDRRAAGDTGGMDDYGSLTSDLLDRPM